MSYQTDDAKPIKVLQIAGGLDRAGAETWLMHVLRHIDRSRFSIDFVVHSDKKFDYEDEVVELGSRIYRSTSIKNPLKYAVDLYRILQEGKYDVVHTHVNHFGALPLAVARLNGVRNRIAHSHSDLSRVQRDAIVRRKAYYRIMKKIIALNATAGLAGSTEAAESLFGAKSIESGFATILRYGIDLGPFRRLIHCEQVLKSDLGIPTGTLVIGHVGRFIEAKNHTFLISMFQDLLRSGINAHLLLIGEGPLRRTIETRVAEDGIQDKVTFTGVRTDVAEILRDVVDVFVLPSLYEGMPLVGIEAQAAGVPIFTSTNVTSELIVNPDLNFRLPLSLGPVGWAERIIAENRSFALSDFKGTVAVVESSEFNIVNGVKVLEMLYAD